MLVVGLTGSLATGKSLVAKLFSEWGATIIDADKIAHKLIAPLSPCYARILRVFGPAIISKGIIDRKKLASIVFDDPTKLLKLEKIIHPEVVDVVIRKIEKVKKNKTNKLIVLDVPLLFEVGLEGYCDFTVVVRATQKEQVDRAHKRLGITKIEALRRIKSQMSLSEKCRLADFIINNKDDLKNTKKQAKEIWKKILIKKK